MPNLKLIDASLTRSGNLKGKAIVTGAAVIDYRDIYGFYALRPPEEVFKEESMATLKGVSITRGHPWEYLNWDNTKWYSIGWTGDDVQRENEDISVNLTFIESDAIRLILVKLQDGEPVLFSTGGSADYINQPGTYNGQDYQVYLKNIYYEHLACLLDGEQPRYPRTGMTQDNNSKKGRLFLTDGRLVLPCSTQDNNAERGIKKVKITLPKGAVVDVDDNEAQHVQNLITDHNSLGAQVATLEGKISTLERKQEALKTPDSKVLNDHMQKHVELAAEVADLALIDGKGLKDLVPMSEEQIKEAVLLADGHSQESLTEAKAKHGQNYGFFLDGVYSQIKKDRAVTNSDSVLKAFSKTEDSEQLETDDAAPIGAKDPRAKQRERMNNRCKGA